MAALAIACACAERQLLEDADLPRSARRSRGAGRSRGPCGRSAPARPRGPAPSLTMNWPAALMTLVLKLPHRPRSAVITISSGAAAGSSGIAQQRMRVVIDARDQAVEHRAASAARTAAPRRRAPARGAGCDAATIFIALVICCVDLTARIRRRRSISDGMGARGSRYAAAVPRAGGELLAEFLQRRFERRPSARRRGSSSRRCR